MKQQLIVSPWFYVAGGLFSMFWVFGNSAKSVGEFLENILYALPAAIILLPIMYVIVSRRNSSKRKASDPSQRSLPTPCGQRPGDRAHTPPHRVLVADERASVWRAGAELSGLVRFRTEPEQRLLGCIATQSGLPFLPRLAPLGPPARGFLCGFTLNTTSLLRVVRTRNLRIDYENRSHLRLRTSAGDRRLCLSHDLRGCADTIRIWNHRYGRW
ncbi:hypothetical protein AFFFEF_02485 [Methylorubrum extorquens]